MSPRRSWLPCSAESPFSIANIPFGIISTPEDKHPRVATVIGNYVFDLAAYVSASRQTPSQDNLLLPEVIYRHRSVFACSSLNTLARLGRSTTSAIRLTLQAVLTDGAIDDFTAERDSLRAYRAMTQKSALFLPLDGVKTHLPFSIGDYTDFYAGLHHAMNCGALMRGLGQELQPNYKHLPVAYHGRASSVVVSGTPITRPSGQILLDPERQEPTFSESRKLDFELELGCFVAKPSDMGRPVSVQEAYQEHLFGIVLLNDWSARDIQAWEMVPLGPLNAKNFGTTVSPWVVTLDALEPFLVPTLQSARPLIRYLQGDRDTMVPSIELSVKLQSGSSLKPCGQPGLAY